MSVDDLLQAVDNFEKLAKDTKKLDPKAKIRNRGTVCVPASSAKDKKDHFPINNEAQARNALARVHQYDKVPSWYSGSLKSLQELVSRKVHSKYKSIGKSEKKSSADYLLAKYGQDANAFYNVLTHYDTGAAALKDFAEGMKMSAETFGREANLDDPNERKTYEVLLKQAHLVLDVMPEMEALDQELYATNSPGGEEDKETPPSETIASRTTLLLEKYGQTAPLAPTTKPDPQTSEILASLEQASKLVEGCMDKIRTSQDTGVYDNALTRLKGLVEAASYKHTYDKFHDR